MPGSPAARLPASTAQACAHARARALPPLSGACCRAGRSGGANVPAACWDPASRPEGYCPDDLPSGWPGAIFDGVEIVSVVIFTVEYIARMYAIGECDEYLGWRGKFRFLITPFSLIDLASIVPFYVDLVRLPSPLRGPPRRCGSVRRPPARRVATQAPCEAEWPRRRRSPATRSRRCSSSV